MAHGDGEWTFAVALAHLRETLHPKDRGPYSFAEIGKGTGLSRGYVHNLTRGARTRPRYEDVEALAQFFGVPTRYFYDRDLAARVDGEIAAVIERRDQDVDLGGSRLAQRVLDLSPKDREAVTEMVQRMQDYQAEPRDGRRRRKPE